MNKMRIKDLIRKLGMNLVHVDRLGVDLERDITRLMAEQPLKTIFDVGGNYGQTAIRYAHAFPKARIFSFEPVPSSFQQLQHNTRSYPNVMAYNVALGDTSGKIGINVTVDSGSNSILPPQAQPLANTMDVCIDTLDLFARKNAIDEIDLLKMDVEGYELQVLQGAQTFLEEGRVRFIYAECVFAQDTHSPHTSFFDLHRRLEPYGYSFVTYYSESFTLQNGCALGNALFALQSKLPREVSGNIRNIV